MNSEKVRYYKQNTGLYFIYDINLLSLDSNCVS